MIVATGKHAVQGDSGKKHDSHRIHFFDGIKLSRMLGTATAAVTTSLISTHFLNTLSTVIVVFLTSIITGLSVELWSRTLHKTGQDAAKMVARIPYDRILPKPVAGNINEKLENFIHEPDDDDGDGLDTDEYRAIRDALLNDPEFQALGMASDTSHAGKASDGDEQVIDCAIRTINDTCMGTADSRENDAESVPVPKYSSWSDEHPDASDGTARRDNVTKPYALVKKLFGLDRSTEQSPTWKIFRLVILFCIVSVFTVGGVWLSETFIAKPDVTNVYRTTGLSRNDKQAIYDATQKQIDDRLTELEDLKARMDSLDSTMNDLHDRVQSLDGENNNTAGNTGNNDNGNHDNGNNNGSGNNSQSPGNNTGNSDTGNQNTGNNTTGNTGDNGNDTGNGTNQGTTNQNNATKQDITTLNQQITDMQAEIQDLRKQLELMQQQSSTQSPSPSPSPSPTTTR